jgi:predicted metal-dependent peptidase
LLDPKYVGWTTKEIFNDLRKQKEETGKGPGDNFDVHDWEGLDQLSPDEKQALTQEVERAIAQGKIAKDRADKAGGGTGSLPLSLTEMLRPKVDWRAQLSDFVRSQCQAKDTSTWRKPNRRFIGEGIYIPTLIGERVGCAVVGYDTSSSNMSPASVQACMSEVKGLLDAVKPEATHLIYWDTEVNGHEVYTDANRSMMLTSTKPKGGGGTSPKCLSKYLRENHIKPDCIIMLTDGEISDWGTDWPAPILWVVINRTTYTAPVGKTIQIKEV